VDEFFSIYPPYYKDDEDYIKYIISKEGEDRGFAIDEVAHCSSNVTTITLKPFIHNTDIYLQESDILKLTKNASKKDSFEIADIAQSSNLYVIFDKNGINRLNFLNMSGALFAGTSEYKMKYVLQNM
jgi:hypothetical protein